MLPEAELLPPQVLVVDANARHCLLYRMEMEAHGYAVSCAHNGQDALLKLQARHFDLAVVDVSLPDISANDLLKQISACRDLENRRLPIIINTAYPYSQQQASRWPADAFLIKSSNLDGLLRKIMLFLNPKNLRSKAPNRFRGYRFFRQRDLFIDCIV